MIFNDIRIEEFFAKAQQAEASRNAHQAEAGRRTHVMLDSHSEPPIVGYN